MMAITGRPEAIIGSAEHCLPACIYCNGIIMGETEVMLACQRSLHFMENLCQGGNTPGVLGM